MVFSISTLNKVIFIFMISFVSRVFINNVYNVNVFSYYLNQVSVVYYLSFSWFIMIIHLFYDYFHFNDIPSSEFKFSSSVNKFKLSTVSEMRPFEEMGSSNNDDGIGNDAAISDTEEKGLKEVDMEEISKIRENKNNSEGKKVEEKNKVTKKKWTHPKTFRGQLVSSREEYNRLKNQDLYDTGRQVTRKQRWEEHWRRKAEEDAKMDAAVTLLSINSNTKNNYPYLTNSNTNNTITNIRK
jgi:hypothetical protein